MILQSKNKKIPNFIKNDLKIEEKRENINSLIKVRKGGIQYNVDDIGNILNLKNSSLTLNKRELLTELFCRFI